MALRMLRLAIGVRVWGGRKGLQRMERSQAVTG